MSTVLGTAMRAQLELIRPLMKKLTIEGQRITQDALGKLGAKALEGKVSYREEPFENFAAQWAHNIEQPNENAILYIHGGSYTAGSIEYAMGFGGVLCETTGCETLCVGYRLAPEFPFPAALEDAVSAYERILESYPPERIAVVGESAGGGLIFCLMQKIKELELAMPACIVALSPWTNLTCSSPAFVTKADVDPCLFEDALKYSAELYSGGDLKNPLISPIYGDLSGLPPVLLFAGDYEMLEDDTVLLAHKLLEQGVECSAHYEPGMWHVYVLYGTPEAKEAMIKIDAFLQLHLPKE